MLNVSRVPFAFTYLRSGQFVLAGKTVAVDTKANAERRNYGRRWRLSRRQLFRLQRVAKSNC